MTNSTLVVAGKPKVGGAIWSATTNVEFVMFYVSFNNN